MQKKTSIKEITESLSPLERQIIPFLNEGVESIEKKSGLDSVSVFRALRFLENKEIIKINIDKKTIINLGTNGIYYKKNALPERTLLMILEKDDHCSIDHAKKTSNLSENEFKVALGVLKNKALISMSNGKISLIATKEELIKKTLEEQFLEVLPIEEKILSPEQRAAFENLRKRKDIIEIKNKKIVTFSLTDLGKELAGKIIESSLIEEVTPEIIKSNKIRKFRKYDIQARVPKIFGGKKHFVNQAIKYAKQIWLEMGFKEISGNLIETSFWNFDALFTPQDHPARDMQDTFFLNQHKGTLPKDSITEKVREAHESGVAQSKGWNYKWNSDEAKKLVLRTHTTAVSACILANLKQKDLPAKYFVIGKVFRNETIDWSHGFEFYQTEGIVVDENVTFRDLIGYLKEFYNKMGFTKIRFRPSFFAYTEPSVEIEIFHPTKKKWIELGGAGIFRPEVTLPLLGKPIPVLAWGQGFDRIIMDFYKINDLREMYSNDIKELRAKKFWIT